MCVTFNNISDTHTLSNRTQQVISLWAWKIGDWYLHSHV